MRRWIAGVLGALALAGAARAEPVSGAEATKLLFAAKGADFALVRDGGLDGGQLAVIEAILAQMRAQGAANYYGAIAVSPAFFEMMAADPGQAALSGLLQAAERFHSVQAAARAALRACEAARKPGQAPCVLAAQVLPKQYTVQPVQLSVAATQAFRDYRKGRGAKALAISTATTAFAVAKGEAAETAALTACNRSAQAQGAADCVVVVKD